MSPLEFSKRFALPETQPAPVPAKKVITRKMYERVYGDRYAETVGKSTVQIAAIIRNDLKAKFPAFKISVRSEYFAGGSAINVNVTAVPEGFGILNPLWVAWDVKHPHEIHPHYECEAGGTGLGKFERMTPPALTMLHEIEALVGAFNHDGSESQVDYFDVNFYKHIGFSWELEKADTDRIKATLS